MIDLVVISTLGRLVAKEVNDLVADTVGLLGFGFDVLEAVGLVPTCRENVERNLATDRVSAPCQPSCRSNRDDGKEQRTLVPSL